jgi:hypothetical protein
MPIFLKLPATAEQYMGGLRTRGTLGYPIIPISSKQQETELFLRIKE